MADKLFLSITNMDKIFANLNKLSENIKTEVVLEMNAAALNIQSNAKKMAPVNMGTLRNSIQLKEQLGENKVSYIVGSALKYAPYIEFGTGGLVSVPKGYEDLAILFKGKNKKKINIRPKAYLIPAYEIEKPKLIKKIKDILNAQS